MWDNKKKAVTFSFDDGVVQDIRFIELLEKYNMKGTFNLQSGAFGLSQMRDILKSGAVGKPEIIDGKEYHRERTLKEFVLPNDVREIYKNQEVACHTLSHPKLEGLADQTIVFQVEQDRKILEELTGKEVVGLAYPCGGVDFDRVEKLLKEQTKIKYARAGCMDYSFEFPKSLFNIRMTISFAREKQLEELTDKFINSTFDEPVVFMFGGHTYEMDDDYASWGRMEEFMQTISNRKDIFYGTNAEVYLGKWGKAQWTFRN